MGILCPFDVQWARDEQAGKEQGTGSEQKGEPKDGKSHTSGACRGFCGDLATGRCIKMVEEWKKKSKTLLLPSLEARV